MEAEQLFIIKQWLDAGSLDLFGLPYAGKDTHGNELAKIFNAPLIGGGEILRSASMPDRIKNLMSTGELLPTKDYLELVLPHLSNPKNQSKPLILSSVGRWHGEENGVLEATAQAGHPLKVVIFLKINKKEVRRRWLIAQKSGVRTHRADEEAKTLEIRITEFKNKTLPVIEFYRQKNLLIEIDGSLPTTQVLQTILLKLLKLAKSASRL